MFLRLRDRISIFLISVLTVSLLTYPGLAAEDHVVGPSELKAAVHEASQAREADLAAVRGFLSSEPAAGTLRSMHLDPVKVERAVSQLDDQELARLASRAGQIQKDLAAGALTNQQITYILIALATAVIVLIAVH